MLQIGKTDDIFFTIAQRAGFQCRCSHQKLGSRRVLSYRVELPDQTHGNDLQS